MTRYLARAVVVLGIACMFMPSTAAGQVPPTENELLAAVAQSPHQVSNYLDLVKIYVDQGRFDEAEQMLGRALAVIRQQRMATTTPSAGGQAPVRVGGGIKEPTKIHDVRPVYPADAQAAHTQGIVILETVIGPQGNVTDARVMRSVSASLDQAAVDAVRQWVFTPTLVNGVPVPVIMTVTVNFLLR
ncbi:MAG TPA: TonB family protein [Vicinamibacterales bacterium]|nr:TonB family protein [Vicinamibacterales bacterium]